MSFEFSSASFQDQQSTSGRFEALPLSSFSSGNASGNASSSSSNRTVVSQIAKDLLASLSQQSGSVSYSSGGASVSGAGASFGSSSGSASGSGAALGSSFGFGSGSGFAAGSSSGSGAGSASGFGLGSGASAGASGSYSAVLSTGSGFGSRSGAGSSGGAFLSQIEQAILQSSTSPVEINESEEITVNGQRGIWANRAEVVNWKGSVPITEYQINEDSNPEIITKGSKQKLEYIQELAIRYLRPPTPPTPGEIIINQEANGLVAPAPPLIIRQQPARPETPEPLVIREAPPKAPAPVGQKVITISGKRVPPPPRKVVIERLAPLPSKPQSVLVERWLPYAQVKRRVIFRGAQADPVLVKPRNVIVQWEAPQVVVKKEFKYLGVIKANPAEYVQRYSTSLVQSSALPQFVQDIKTPDGLVLAANSKQAGLYELEGDLQAFKLVDLDREGLSEYRAYLQRLGISYDAYAAASFGANGSNGASFSASGSGGSSFGSSGSGSSSLGLSGGAGGSSFSYGGSGGASFGSSGSGSSSSGPSGSLSAIIEQIFRTINVNGNNTISVEEAEKVVLRLNSRLGRNYGEDDVRAFFAALDVNNDGGLSLEEFKRAFLSVLNAN